jgi:chromosomal replication initiation ATPase DnaA
MDRSDIATITRILELVGNEFRACPRALLSLDHSTRRITLVRHVAMHLIHEILNANYTETAAIFRRDPCTGRGGIVRVQEMRENDPSLDRTLKAIAREVRKKR